MQRETVTIAGGESVPVCVVDPAQASAAIYLIVHRESRRAYVGLTQDSVARRWIHHRSDAKHGGGPTHLARAIRAYGADAFELHVIEHGLALPNLPTREIHWIATLRCMDPRLGFNVSPGGTVASSKSPAARARISAALTGRKKPPLSEAHRKAIGDLHRGRKRAPETGARIAAALRGRVQTDEHRAKNKAQAERYWSSETARLAAAERAAGRKQSAATIEKRMATMAARDDTERRRAIAEASRLRWADPEYRARVRAAIKQGQEAARGA